MAAQRVYELRRVAEVILPRCAAGVDEESRGGRIEMELGRSDQSALQSRFGVGAIDWPAVHHSAISPKWHWRYRSNRKCWSECFNAPDRRHERLGQNAEWNPARPDRLAGLAQLEGPTGQFAQRDA